MGGFNHSNLFNFKISEVLREDSLAHFNNFIIQFFFFFYATFFFLTIFRLLEFAWLFGFIVLKLNLLPSKILFFYVQNSETLIEKTAQKFY